MFTRSAVLAALVVAPLTFGVPAAMAAPTVVHAATVTCTLTASHTCIRGGEFCPSARTGHKGIDAKGRVYLCKSGHWRKG